MYPGSSLTKGQLFTLICAFLLRHCCTEAATADLILLLNTLVPGCMPHSLYYFKKVLQPGVAGNIDTHLLCAKCGEYLCKLTSRLTTYVCPECASLLNIKELVTNGSTFLIYSLEQQLKNLFQKMNIASKLLHTGSMAADAINDIHDGSGYKKLSAKFPNSITLSCNTDGIPAFASSNTSLWPVYFVINELPLSLRHVHMMLAALWIGPSKPRLDALFKPIVNSLEKLCDSGFSWVHDGKVTVTKAYMCIVSCDSVARPLLQNLKQFNGEYGCGFCLSAGTVVEKGLGYVRSYVECGERALERTHDQMLEWAQSAVENQSCVFGVKGPSILSLVPSFNIVSGFVPEYMHSVLLGVVRQFVFLWFDSSSNSKAYYLGRCVDAIDRQLLAIKPPSAIKRLPRSLTFRKYWKASEWRNFLLFYSPITLKGYLPREYFRHWYLLVFSIFHLMMTPISSETLHVVQCALRKFVARVPDLYGVQHVSFNVHLLSHLVDSVRRWGPLWSCSAFFFEDANGKLLTFFHGTRGVAHQIFRSFIGVSHLRRLANLYVSDTSAVVLDQIVNMTSYCKNALKLSNNVTCLGYHTQRNLTADELIAVRNVCNTSHICSLEVSAYKRVVINGTVLHTDSYSKAVRHSDCFFSTNRNETFMLSDCVVVELCANHECSEQHNVCKDLLLLAYPICESVVQNYDKEVNANLSTHVRKAVIDYTVVVAVEPSKFCCKVFMVSDESANKFLIPLPTFELD